MEAAGQPTEEASAKIARWHKVQKDFLSRTGLKRQPDREAVAGFGKNEAAKARGESRKRPLPKSVKAPDAVLQQTLGAPRIKGILPEGALIGSVRIIAGAGTSTVFRNAQELAEVYGGDSLLWQKKVV